MVPVAQLDRATALLSRGSGVRIPPGCPKKRNSRKSFSPYGLFFITLKEMQGYGAKYSFYTCSILYIRI